MGHDPAGAELTIEHAADLLNVSQQYLVTLMDERRIPVHSVGDRRTVFLADVLDYKRHDDAVRDEILDELTGEAEQLGLEY